MVFYDMELSLPGRTTAGSPDCLAVTVDNGKVTGIILIEVKSNISACNGKHGVSKHAKDFCDILSDRENRKNLYASMKDAIHNYHELGMHTGIHDYCEFDKCAFDIRFLFTAEAIDWTKSAARGAIENFKEYNLPVNEDANRKWKRIELLPDCQTTISKPDSRTEDV